MPGVFPHAIRDVHVRYAKNIGACGPFADITVDFEPLPDGMTEFDFVNLVDETDLPPEFAEAVADGIRRELLGDVDERAKPLPQAGPEALAVQVALTHARWHELDSTESGFRQAGRLAVRAALDQSRPPKRRKKRR
jgi:translation elongation factor EF-G